MPAIILFNPHDEHRLPENVITKLQKELDAYGELTYLGKGANAYTYKGSLKTGLPICIKIPIF